jgi:hypothetical protein
MAAEQRSRAVTTGLAFGRSETVAVSVEGASVATRVVALDAVSVTGSEYPSLFAATSHIEADMLARTGDGGLVIMQAKEFTSRPIRHRWGVLDAYLRARIKRHGLILSRGPGWTALMGEGLTARTIGRPFDLLVIDEVLSAAPPRDDDAIFLAVESLRAHLADVLPAEPGPADADDQAASDEDGSLLSLADRVQAIAVEPPPAVELSGNLTRDVLALTGLTAAELATAIGRTERSVRTWIAEGQVSEAMRPLLQQVRTIALRLVGGLGPDGVRRWLMAGEPSALSRIASGDVADVLAETGDLLDSPAT